MSDRLDRIEKLFEKMVLDNIERDKKADKRAKEADEKEERRFKKRDKELKRLEKMFDWMGYTQWMISEDLVWENFQDVLNETWESISSTNRNIEVFEWKRKVAEFDIVWVNGTKVFVWETKTKLTKKHIDKFIDKTLPNFEKYLLKKRYSWLKMFWVMWARVFDDDKTKDYAISKWLYIMKESHKWNLKMIKKSIENAKVFA